MLPVINEKRRVVIAQSVPAITAAALKKSDSGSVSGVIDPGALEVAYKHRISRALRVVKAMQRALQQRHRNRGEPHKPGFARVRVNSALSVKPGAGVMHGAGAFARARCAE